jgi:hypothetical protein
MLQQLAQRFADGRVGVMGKDNPPTSLREILGVYAFLDAEVRLGGLTAPPLQLVQVLFIQFFALSDLRDILRRHRG